MADAMSLEGDNEPRISFLFVTQTFIAIKRNQDSIAQWGYGDRFWKFSYNIYLSQTILYTLVMHMIAISSVF